jgi:hypothetical protein
MLQSQAVSDTTTFLGENAMKEPKLRRQNDPPKAGPEVEVIRVVPGAGVRGQIISDGIWGCWTHWDGRRSRECTAEGPLCDGHRAGWPQRWKGYIYIYCAVRKACVFLELTPAAGEELIRQNGSSSGLRGRLLRMDRHGASLRAKIIVELTAGLNGLHNLPEEANPEGILRKLWGWGNKPCKKDDEFVQ